MVDVLALGGAGSWNPTLTSDLLEPALRLVILGKAFFVESEC